MLIYQTPPSLQSYNSPVIRDIASSVSSSMIDNTAIFVQKKEADGYWYNVNAIYVDDTHFTILSC
jgi:hypothetical protein